MTSNSFTISVTGTLETPAPADAANILYITNGTGFTPPGFVTTPGFYSTNTVSSTIPRPIEVLFPVEASNTALENYIFIKFNGDFAVNEDISGAVTASWSSEYLTPSNVTAVDLRWGLTGLTNGASGPIIATKAVPEPFFARMTRPWHVGCAGCAQKEGLIFFPDSPWWPKHRSGTRKRHRITPVRQPVQSKKPRAADLDRATQSYRHVPR